MLLLLLLLLTDIGLGQVCNPSCDDIKACDRDLPYLGYFEDIR